MQPGRRIVVVEIACLTTGYDRIDDLAGRRVKPRRREFGHRRKTFAGIEGAPPVVFLERHRQWIVQRPEVPRPSPTVGRRAESVGTSVVGACQSATEFMRGRARRSGRNQPLQRQADVVVLDHPRTRHSVLSG